MKTKTISVIGLGYIGLPTAAMFAQAKSKVIGVDVVSSVVDTINQGNIHIVEPGLEEIVKVAVKNGYLKATTTPEPSDAFLITVPTPFKEDYQPDLSYIHSAVKMIAPVLKKGDIIILESTSPVGTTEQMMLWLSELRPDLEFPLNDNDNPDVYIAYCPERVLPGKVIEELVSNDRIIGGITPNCALLAESIYRIFVKGQLLHTNARTAEMSKLTENSFRDVNIAFANELSMICDKLDINVWELISLANRHPRVNILQPGPGVGGHCIAVDPWFIVRKTPNQARLIKMARIVNDSKPEWVVDKVNEKVIEVLRNDSDKLLKSVTIACLGLSFKADIDDLRESPAVEITKALAKVYVGQIIAVEPYINQLPVDLADLSISYATLDNAIKAADVVVILVDHMQFRSVDQDVWQTKVILDTRGLIR